MKKTAKPKRRKLPEWMTRNAADVLTIVPIKKRQAKQVLQLAMKLLDAGDRASR
jgi:hypothetical protein